MKIVCLGGGPAGLYFSVLAKKGNPSWDITVIERNRPDSTFGWGVVFSDRTMGGFQEADPETHARITQAFRHWDDIDVFFKGQKITSSGHGFCGIARIKLLQILQQRATDLGVKLVYQTEVTDPDVYARDCDLMIGADGSSSITRKRFESVFKPNIQVRNNRFIWLGTKKKLDAFTFDFKQTEWGWFNLHAYRFDEDWSTFIVETPEKNWLAAGIDKMEPEESIALCENLFSERLDGNALTSNAKHLRGSAVWLKFARVLCEQWYHKNIVLIGDAAHTAHFGIGSGTKLAMEDAMSLVARVARADDVQAGLRTYQAERSLEALKLQSAARNRMEWFENVARYAILEPRQFAYALLTGSQRIGHANLKLRDSGFVEEYERWLGERSGVPDAARPPMFLPFQLAGMGLANRVVVSPMAQYMAKGGVPDDWHLMHYGARAV